MRLTHSSRSSRSENFGACSLPLPVLHPWLWPWRRSLRDWSPQRLSWAFQLLCCHRLWSFPQRSLWRLPQPLPEVVERSRCSGLGSSPRPLLWPLWNFCVPLPWLVPESTS